MSTRYLVVACTPYSGSTLLASLLGAHPQIATVSEVSGTKRESGLATFRCSCGRLMVECPFWREVQDRMQGMGFEDFTLGDFGLRFDAPGPARRFRVGSLHWSIAEDIRDAALSLIPRHDRSMREVALRNQAFANVVLAITGKRVFADASKEPMRLRYLHRLLNMEMKALHLVRDVRGVAASGAKHGTQPDVRAAARMWVRVNATLMRHLDRLSPESRMIVRYEDLCRDTDAVMAKIFAFCGVDGFLGDALSGGSRSQHLLGNRSRLEGMTEIRLDESWRSLLTEADLATISRESSSFAQELDRLDAGTHA